MEINRTQHQQKGFTVFCYSLLIKEHHLDTFGHVNNATYLELFEEARWEFLNSRGINLNSIQVSNIGPVVLQCNLQFLKELRLRKSIIIESQVVSYDGKTGEMQQTMIDEQQEVYCRALFTFGVFDLNSRKLILPPMEWQQALGIE